ncbi:hypothetical protein IJ541_04745 [bacterium]|nr:hypothetical protein [bacterium]
MLNTVTKIAIKVAKSQTPRLFSIVRNAKIGTEITNNLTGTRYFRNALAGKTVGNVVYPNNATVIEKAGKYYGITGNMFDNLLRYAETFNPPKSLKPMIFAGDGTRPTTLVKAEYLDKFLTGILPK